MALLMKGWKQTSPKDFPNKRNSLLQVCQGYLKSQGVDFGFHPNFFAFSNF
jgi:hypothetical protein